jgi:anti-anti-sigma regulatory factor
LARTAREHGGQCILAGASPVVLRSLELMKLRAFFTEAPDLATANSLLS